MFVRFFVVVVAVLGLAGSLQAECVGADLRAGLTPDQSAALRAQAEAVPYARGILWQATKGNQVVTFVGTLHLPDSRHEAVLDRLQSAIGSAQTLLVEAGPEEEAALQSAMTTQPDMMFKTAGPTLPERLTEAEWLALSQAAEARGFPPFLAAKMQPWFLSMMLAFSPCVMQELQAGQLGLDKLVMQAALGAGVQVRALEPYDTLFHLFLDMTPEEELIALRMSLVNAARGDDMTHTMVESYFDEDIQLIWELGQYFGRLDAGAMFTEAEFDAMSAEAEEELVLARNRAWIAVIEEAASEGPLVVAAGALHMPGEEGVLNLLAERGWEVRPLE